MAVVFAAILDGLDGRVARFLKSSSSFGEQLDSLADFVNFGVAPALVLYLWALKDARTIGWIIALVFAICGCLRLARFNVMLEDPDQPEWQVDFFTGVPAPAGALLVLLPVYLGLLGLEPSTTVTVFSGAYMLLIGFLMVSNIPYLVREEGRAANIQKLGIAGHDRFDADDRCLVQLPLESPGDGYPSIFDHDTIELSRLGQARSRAEIVTKSLGLLKHQSAKTPFRNYSAASGISSTTGFGFFFTRLDDAKPFHLVPLQALEHLKRERYASSH